MNDVYSSKFQKCINTLVGKFHAWEIWADWVYIISAALSQPLDYREDREKRYLDIVSKYEQNEIQTMHDMFDITSDALEENPRQDFLGALYMSLGLGDHWKGQFFTPYHLCEAMAMMVEDDILSEVHTKGFITMNDCACGGGATLIAGFNQAKAQLEKEGLNAQNHVLIAAQDLSEMTALMCYIQLSLLGVAAVVKIGNTLTEPLNGDHLLFMESKPELWFTPMYNFPVWSARRSARMLDFIMGGASKCQN